MNDEQVLIQNFEGKYTKITNNNKWVTGNWFRTSVEPMFVIKEYICRRLSEKWRVNGAQDEQQPNKKVKKV